MIIPSGCMTYLCNNKILKYLLLIVVALIIFSGNVLHAEMPDIPIEGAPAGQAVPSDGLRTPGGNTNVTPLTPAAAANTPINTRTYQPLVGIPGVDNAVTNFGTYINQLYFLAISLAALLAVIKIIIAGVKYMLTDLGSSKADAKSDIWGALLGLLLIISAFLILTTINPNLANLDALSGAPALRPGRAPAPAPLNNTNVPGASPINPTMTNNTIQNTIRAQDGETITQAPADSGGARGAITNETRIQAESQCNNRRGFSLGYTYRNSDGSTRFVSSVAGQSNSSTGLIAIHCSPPATP